MNTITSILFYLSIGVAILVVLIVAGLAIKPHVRIPNRTTAFLPGVLPEQAGLNQAFKRFLQARHGDDLPDIFSVVAWGTGKMVSQRLPLFGTVWIPINWTLDMLPGQAFVLEGRFFWFRRLLFIGTDQYINGQGQFKMSDSILTNANLSASELTLLWIYTILFAPTSLLNSPAIAITGEEANECILSIDSEDGKKRRFTLQLDAETGTLVHMITQRTASKSGVDLDFHVRANGSAEFEAGKGYPRELRFFWEDVPYLKLEVDGVAFNRNIQEILDEASGASEEKAAPSEDSAA